MKKNVLIKGILVLVVVALLTIGFTGCICTTATVNIFIPNPDHRYYYDIYIDDVFWGKTDSLGNITLYDVPIGNLTFDAVSINYFGKAIYNVVCGVNNVAIYTIPYPKFR